MSQSQADTSTGQVPSTSGQGQPGPEMRLPSEPIPTQEAAITNPLEQIVDNLFARVADLERQLAERGTPQGIVPQGIAVEDIAAILTKVETFAKSLTDLRTRFETLLGHFGIKL